MTAAPHFPADANAMTRLLRRLSRIAPRHPRWALDWLVAQEAQCRAQAQRAGALDALVLRFYLLEHRGRALELQADLHRAAQEADPAQMPLQAARVAEALGRLAYQQGNYLDATEHWSRALDWAEAAQDEHMGVSARIGLGQIHYAMGAWSTGLRFHRDALQRLQSLQGAQGQGDSYLAAKVAINLGVGQLESQQIEDAERQFSHGLAAARRGGHQEFEAEAHWHLAQTALARGQMPLAVADCRLALNLANRLQHHWLEAAASRTWTEIALARGDEAAAIRSTRHGLALAERIQSKAEQRRAHLQLAKLLERTGEHREALQHLWRVVDLQTELDRQAQRSGPAALSRLPTGGDEALSYQGPSAN